MAQGTTTNTVTDRILMRLKTRGEASAANLGQCLGVTSEAVRQQLVKLAAEGLVEQRSSAQGRGRPVQLWRLTREGNQRFPDTHAELTVKLLETIRSTLGAPAMDLLIGAREQETRALYEAAVAGLATIEERLERLVSIRTQEGYMAEWRAAEDGNGWLFIENHCPICAAATACQGFCRAELELFRAVLGPEVAIERTEHIIAGGLRCSYHVTPVDRQSLGTQLLEVP